MALGRPETRSERFKKLKKCSLFVGVFVPKLRPRICNETDEYNANSHSTDLNLIITDNVCDIFVLNEIIKKDQKECFFEKLSLKFVAY